MDSPNREDRLRKCNIVGFWKIKKSTKIGIRAPSSQPTDDESEDDKSNDDGSYEPSAEDAPPSIPMDTFQVEMQATFDQFHLTQNIYGAQLVEIMGLLAVMQTNWYIRRYP